MIYLNICIADLGPPVNQISSQQEFDEAKERSELFFLFAGDEQGSLWENYLKVCKNMRNI